MKIDISDLSPAAVMAALYMEVDPKGEGTLDTPSYRTVAEAQAAVLGVKLSAKEIDTTEYEAKHAPAGKGLEVVSALRAGGRVARKAEDASYVRALPVDVAAIELAEASKDDPVAK